MAAMGWWSIDEADDSTMGDAPADDSSRAFDKIARMRLAAGKPHLRFDDIAQLLATAPGRSGRDVLPRDESQITGVTLKFESGAPITVGCDEPKLPKEEIAVMRSWLQGIATAYRANVQRRPT